LLFIGSVDDGRADVIEHPSITVAAVTVDNNFWSALKLFWQLFCYFLALASLEAVSFKTDILVTGQFERCFGDLGHALSSALYDSQQVAYQFLLFEKPFMCLQFSLS